MKRKWMLTLCLLAAGAFMSLQGQKAVQLSVTEAQEYALQHNKRVLNAEKDVEVASLSVWEAVSAGLPQVNADASVMDNLKLMTTLIPAEFFGGAPGTYAEVQFGTKFNSNASFTASQLLFSAPYLVGLETVKIYEKLSQQGLEKTELDTREGVINTYYLILVTEEFLRITGGNIDNLKKIKKQTEVMFSAGMAEATDVDQMATNVVNVETSLKSLERSLEMNYNMLRFQLGLEAGAPVELTDELGQILEEIAVLESLQQDFRMMEHIDFRMMETQMQLAEKSLKAEKATVLPTLSTFYSYTQSGMGDKLTDQDWFPSQMLGVNLSVPVFASGQRYTRIKKAEVEVEKARNTRDLVSDQLSMQEKQYRYNLRSALEQYQSQKENLEVAGRVYDNISLKYEQGIVSSLDLTQANTNKLQAENNYINAVLSLLQAKVSLDKLLNNL